MYFLARSCLLISVTLLSGLASLANADTYDGYAITKIQFPGSIPTLGANGINNSGEIVGIYGADNYHINSFLDNNGIFNTISVANASTTVAYGINNLDQIVGSVYLNHTQYAFADLNGTASVINVFNSESATAYRINDHGEIVGTYLTVGGGTYGFTYQNGVATSLQFPGAYNAWAVGVNNAGEVVGYYADKSYQLHGFTYLNGTYSAFAPDVPYVLPLAINNKGEIVGVVDVNGVVNSSFIDITGQFSTFDLGAIQDVNDSGQLVGLIGGGGFEATPTPEPSSLGFTVLSGLVFGLYSLKAARTKARIDAGL